MDIDCVCRSIQLLVYYGCAIVSDIFKFSNIYELNNNWLANIHVYLHAYDHNNPKHQHIEDVLSECAAFCFKSTSTLSQLSGNPKLIYAIIELLCQFLLIFNIPSRPIRDFRAHLQHIGNESLKKVNIRKLIAIDQAKGILRRVQEYPCYLFDPIHVLQQSSSFHQHEMFSGSNLTNSSSSSQIFPGHQSPPLNTSGQGQGYPMRKRNSSSDFVFMSFESLSSFGNATNTTVTNHIISDSTDLLKLEEILPTLNGSKTLDEICCQFDLVAADILDHKDIAVIYK